MLEQVGDREVLAVICTHGHASHVAAAVEVAERDEAPVALHRSDRLLWRMSHAEAEPEIEMADGGRFEVADVHLEVIHTPGHTPGSVSLYCADLEVVFTGDALARRAGRCRTTGSFPTSPASSPRSASGCSTSRRDTRVLPGHGEETTIGDAAKRFDGWVTAGPAGTWADPRESAAVRSGKKRGCGGAARFRGHAEAALLVHADPADHLAGLPAPVPDELPRPAGPAEGAAVGAQQPRRERAQRAGGLVAAAAAAAHGGGGRRAARPGLDQRGVRERRAVGPVPGLGAAAGGGVRRRARPGRRAGRRGADGGDEDRRDRGLRADRPARRPAARRRADGTELVVVDYKTGRHLLSVDDARSSLALALYALAASRVAAPRLPPGRAAPPAERAGARLGAHRGVAAAAPAAGRGRRRGVRRGRRADARPAAQGQSTTRSSRRPAAGGQPGCGWCDYRRSSGGREGQRPRRPHRSPGRRPGEPPMGGPATSASPLGPPGPRPRSRTW